jgi:predicted transcriptional regulator
MDQEKIDLLVGVTADVVSAYVANNPVPSDQLPSLIGSIHQSLFNLASGEKPATPEPQKPAVSIKKSVTPEFIISLEDGKKFKSLKRHLATHYGMSPSEYRAKWNLPSDYPMVAPNYAATRSALAKRLGLGRKPEATPAAPVVEQRPTRDKKREAAEAPVVAKRRTRKKETA